MGGAVTKCTSAVTKLGLQVKYNVPLHRAVWFITVTIRHALEPEAKTKTGKVCHHSHRSRC